MLSAFLEVYLRVIISCSSLVCVLFLCVMINSVIIDKNVKQGELIRFLDSSIEYSFDVVCKDYKDNLIKILFENKELMAYELRQELESVLEERTNYKCLYDIRITDIDLLREQCSVRINITYDVAFNKKETYCYRKKLDAAKFRFD